LASVVRQGSGHVSCGGAELNSQGVALLARKKTKKKKKDGFGEVAACQMNV
jgi:hypothetical protein